MSEPLYVPPASDPASAHALYNESTDPFEAEVIDAYFRPHAPPMGDELPTATEATDSTVAVPTVLTCRSITLQTAWPPMQVLGVDLRRKNVVLNAVAASGFVYVSDDRGILNSTNRIAGVGVFRLTPGMTVTLDGFTGPLWAWSDTDGNVVNAIAVTFA